MMHDMRADVSLKCTDLKCNSAHTVYNACLGLGQMHHCMKGPSGAGAKPNQANKEERESEN